MGPDDLRVVIVDGGSAHHELNLLRNRFGLVPDGHRDTLFHQALHVFVLIHVRTADGDSHPLQHFRQGRHGNTADPDQVAPPARREKIIKFSHILLHCL